MYFWHWARCLSAKGEKQTKMTHGHELCQRWNGTGDPPLRHSPPFVGAPALEVTHPFHFKMTPSMLLGPTCNHDLNCFLRLPNVRADSGTREGVIDAMLDAMGDHEYHSASYASKVEPQMEGLMHTLIDGLRRKEAEIHELREAGKDFMPHEIARGILHRLISCTNRRMHKGFPEMLTYLLRKPMEYSSHKFVHVPIDPLIRHTISCVKSVVANATPAHVVPGYPLQRMLINTKPVLYGIDYQYRNKRLDLMPLYFFFSSCEVSHKLGARSLHWEELRKGENVLRQRSYKQQPGLVHTFLTCLFCILLVSLSMNMNFIIDCEHTKLGACLFFLGSSPAHRTLTLQSQSAGFTLRFLCYFSGSIGNFKISFAWPWEVFNKLPRWMMFGA